MRAVVVTGPTVRDWTEAIINGDLKDLQRLVGGYIEGLPLDSSKATVFVNEEGKLDGLPQTAILTNDVGTVMDIITGPFVILGPTDEEGEVQELTDEALAYVKQFVRPIYGPSNE